MTAVRHAQLPPLETLVATHSGVLASWRPRFMVVLVVVVNLIAFHGIWGSFQQQTHVAGSLIGFASIVAGFGQILMVQLIYVVTRRCTGRHCVAPWLKYVVFAYLACAVGLRVLATLFERHLGASCGAGLLAAMLGLMGTGLLLQQLNLSFVAQGRDRKCLLLAVGALTLQNLFAFFGIWSWLIHAAIVTSETNYIAIIEPIAGTLAALLVAIAAFFPSRIPLALRRSGT